MELRRPATLAEFLETAAPFLMRHEAEHGLMLGVAADTAPPPPGAYWALVTDGSEVVAAALRTAVKLLLSLEGTAGAMAMLARDAMRAPLRPEATAVLGPPPSVDAFAAAAGAAWREGKAQRIYVLREVVPPRPAPGERRAARPGDRDALVSWTRAFAEETEGRPLDPQLAAGSVDRRIGDGSLHVWDVAGRPVASAAAVAPTPRGIRVSAVYTPPAFRRLGYASALVASLSQHLLDAGYEFAFLYTDVANPTSNGIYQRIGYRPVADVRELWLDRPS